MKKINPLKVNFHNPNSQKETMDKLIELLAETAVSKVNEILKSARGGQI